MSENTLTDRNIRTDIIAVNLIRVWTTFDSLWDRLLQVAAASYSHGCVFQVYSPTAAAAPAAAAAAAALGGRCCSRLPHQRPPPQQQQQQRPLHHQQPPHEQQQQAALVNRRSSSLPVHNSKQCIQCTLIHCVCTFVIKCAHTISTVWQCVHTVCTRFNHIRYVAHTLRLVVQDWNAGEILILMLSPITLLLGSEWWPQST
jgi:hypothetical protein